MVNSNKNVLLKLFLFFISLSPPKKAAMELVTVKTFDNYFTANIFLTRLQADGINCFLKDENTVTIDPILCNAIGGIKLVVAKKDEVTTIKTLRAYQIEYLLSATCPTCGSNSFSYVTKPGASNYLTAIITWLFSSYAVAPEYVYKCGNCNYESENLPDTTGKIEESYL